MTFISRGMSVLLVTILTTNDTASLVRPDGHAAVQKTLQHLIVALLPLLSTFATLGSTSLDPNSILSSTSGSALVGPC